MRMMRFKIIRPQRNTAKSSYRPNLCSKKMTISAAWFAAHLGPIPKISKNPNRKLQSLQEVSLKDRHELALRQPPPQLERGENTWTVWKTSRNILRTSKKHGKMGGSIVDSDPPLLVWSPAKLSPWPKRRSHGPQMIRRSSSGAKVWKSTENVSKMYQKSSKCIELLFELAIWKSRQKLWNLESWTPKSAFRSFLVILFREVDKILGQTRSRLNTLHQTWIRSIKMSWEEKPSALSLLWCLLSQSKSGSNQLWAHHARVRKDESVCSSKTTWRQRVRNTQSKHPNVAERQKRLTLLSTPYSESTRLPYLSRYVR